MKLNQNLTAPGQKQLTALQAKLHYMKIVSELKTFGSRVFMVTLLVGSVAALYEPRCEKTGLRGFEPGRIQTGLHSHRR